MSNEVSQPLEIIVYPDPFLTKPCRAITAEEFKSGVADGWNLEELVARMKATMYASNGIGLAAPQVGVGLRVFVADPSKEHTAFFAILNPKIAETHGSSVEEEGCLSVPEVRAKVKRPAAITITGMDAKGQPLSFGADELLARVCQHEYDHLDGILFINKLGMTGKLLVRRQLVDLEEDYRLTQGRKKLVVRK
jgi:peptide deformylase